MRIIVELDTAEQIKKNGDLHMIIVKLTPLPKALCLFVTIAAGVLCSSDLAMATVNDLCANLAPADRVDTCCVDITDMNPREVVIGVTAANWGTWSLCVDHVGVRSSSPGTIHCWDSLGVYVEDDESEEINGQQSRLFIYAHDPDDPEEEVNDTDFIILAGEEDELTNIYIKCEGPMDFVNPHIHSIDRYDIQDEDNLHMKESIYISGADGEQRVFSLAAFDKQVPIADGSLNCALQWGMFGYTCVSPPCYYCGGTPERVGTGTTDQSFFIQLNGHGGDDTLHAAGGDDFAAGTRTVSRMIGGSGDDKFYAYDGYISQAWMGSGNDVYYGGQEYKATVCDPSGTDIYQMGSGSVAYPPELPTASTHLVCDDDTSTDFFVTGACSVGICEYDSIVSGVDVQFGSYGSSPPVLSSCSSRCPFYAYYDY